MKDIMLDIETMGNSSSASIMSIGACYFNPLTGEIGEKFSEQVNIASNGKIDASTVIWWLKQNDAARSKFFDNEKASNIVGCLSRFSCFAGSDCRVWGNGIAFDNVIVKNAYYSQGMDCPWGFWNDMDVRTVVYIGKLIGLDPKSSLKFEGVRHDALSDAIHQARYVSLILSTIVKKANHDE